MTDEEIIKLYFARSEKAIGETAKKYGKYCYTIANNILNNNEDSEECVNDTYFKTWETIPPERPLRFRAYLAKITRNSALRLYEKYSAEKRGGKETSLALDELTECLPANDTTEQIFTRNQITQTINGFLEKLPEKTRAIFVRRYWYLSDAKEIARDFHMSEGAVRVLLFRTREKLQKILQEEIFS